MDPFSLPPSGVVGPATDLMGLGMCCTDLLLGRAVNELGACEQTGVAAGGQLSKG